MSTLITTLSDLSLWMGAILGAVVSGAFAGSFKIMQSAIRRLPRRRLLGSLAEDSQRCEITIRTLYHESGAFLSFTPDGHTEEIINTQYVHGVGDVQAALRVINLLGQVRHSSGIDVVDIKDASKLGDLPGVAIGGTQRAVEVLKLAPELATSYTGEKILVRNREYTNNGNSDHAVIFRASSSKVKYPQFAIFGLHWVGSRAAGIFLGKHAAILGSLFGKDSFVVVLRSPMSTDDSQVAVAYYAPAPSWLAKLFHPLAWHRFQKLCLPLV